VEKTGLDFLVISALWARKRTHLSRAISGNYGRLVEVEDVAARLTPLAKGHHDAALADDLATSHLYRHLAELLARADQLVALPPK
jgi:hypothetical protein